MSSSIPGGGRAGDSFRLVAKVLKLGNSAIFAERGTDRPFHERAQGGGRPDVGDQIPADGAVGQVDHRQGDALAEGARFRSVQVTSQARDGILDRAVEDAQTCQLPSRIPSAPWISGLPMSRTSTRTGSGAGKRSAERDFCRTDPLCFEQMFDIGRTYERDS